MREAGESADINLAWDPGNAGIESCAGGVGVGVPDVFGSSTGNGLSRLLFEACPDAVVVIDDKGTILFANPAVQQLFGYAPHEVIEQPLAMLQPERLREPHRRGLARYIATGEQQLDWSATQTFGLHRDGYEFPVEIAFTALAPKRFGGFIRDVSKRSEAEQALEASEARYRDLLDNAADVVYQHDLSGVFTYLNRAGLRLFGYTAEEARSLKIGDVVDSEHLAAATRHILAQLAVGEQLEPYELLARTRSGAPVWLEVSVRTARDDAGNLIGYRGIARNISERMRAAEALKLAEERHRELLDNANDIIYTHDLQGNFTYANAAAARTYGRSIEELTRMNIQDLVDPAHLETARTKTVEKLTSGIDATAPYSILTHDRDGRDVWVEVSTRLIRDDNGVPTAVQGIARDITERYLAENELARERALRDHVMECSPNAIAAVDLQGRLTLANRRFCETTGYTQEELQGLTFDGFIAESSRPAIRPLFERVVSGEHVDDLEFDAVRKDGSTFMARASLRPLMEGGEITGVIGITEDITERRRADEALKRSQEFRDRVMDATTNGIAAFDLEGRVTLVNKRLCEVTGFDEHELMGCIMQDVLRLRIEDPSELRPVLRAAAGEHIDGLEIEGFKKDGAPLTLRVTLRPLMEGEEIVGVIGTSEDITERKRSDEALKRAQEFRDRVLDATTNAIAAFDLEGRMTLVNERMCEMTGYTEEELLGQRFNPVFRPGSRSPIPGALKRVMAGESIDNIEFDAMRKDGTTFRGIATLRPLMEGDRVIGVMGTAEDITERKQRELALNRTRELRDRVLESTTNAIGAFDLEGRLTLVNKRLCEMTGYEEEELLGSRLWTLIVPGSTPELRPALKRVMEGESFDDLEFDAVRKDGTPFSARAALRPLFEGDAIVGVMGTAEDITERKRAADVLAAQRQLLEMIAIGAPLRDVLAQVASTVERQSAGRCSILLLDEDGKRLHPAAAPSLPEELVAATEGLEIGPAVGTCGTAAYRGEAVFSEEIASDPRWDGAQELMASVGIVASWSTPIVSGAGAVLGTFAMYYRERHRPTAHEEQIVSGLSHVAGIAIERDRAEARATRQTNLLAEKSALLEAALEAERERARRDPLTGALNHAVIAEEVRRLIDDLETRSFALAMVDVDGLKAVNDTYGHQMGDQVLLAVAASLRAEGAIVGRYGGDEFVAILPDADRERGAAYRQTVTDTLAAVELRDAETGSRIHIDASIGLAIYPEEGDAVEDLIKLSDSAMYAFRRQRADLSAPTAFARIHGGDRAAEIVGEIVPFLTSPGNLQEKLNLVASRVSAGAGYDGVNFALYGNTGPSARTASFSPDSTEAAAQYDAENQPPESPGPMRELLEATRRPVIIDDIASTEFATEAQKQILASVGLLSAMVVPMIWRGVLVGSLSVASKRPAAFGPRDAQFLVAIATQVTSIVRTAALVDDLQAASDRLQEAQTETVLMLAAAAEAHDDTTGRHLKRVRGIAEALAAELGHDEKKAKEIGLAAVLHDIGKIRVPDYVLASSASLSDTEWALMKEHTVWGSEFLGSRGGFELAMQVARSHHERWDGSGYPDGLAGSKIPEAAAITSVADSLDAMISDRPYRPGRPLEDAITEIEAWSGRQFSPTVVDALLALYRRGELAYLAEVDGVRPYAGGSDRLAA